MESSSICITIVENQTCCVVFRVVKIPGSRHTYWCPILIVKVYYYRVVMCECLPSQQEVQTASRYLPFLNLNIDMLSFNDTILWGQCTYISIKFHNVSCVQILNRRTTLIILDCALSKCFILAWKVLRVTLYNSALQYPVRY